MYMRGCDEGERGCGKGESDFLQGANGMTHRAMIMDGEQVLAEDLPVDIDLERGPAGEVVGFWGVAEVPRDWPVDRTGPWRLVLADGREGEIVASRSCGAELGGAVVMFDGLGELRRRDPALGFAQNGR